jgi:hypothetical protein
MNELISRIKDNPKTSSLGVACVALYGAGEALRGSGIEPWGSIVIGLAGLATLLGMLLARDGGNNGGKQP